MEIVQDQPLHSKTDEELLSEFTSKKCTKSLGVLFERHLASAYQLAMKFMHNPADAEDAVQKALINIIRFSSTYSNKGSVKSWIMQTVVNTCKNEIKHLVRHRRHMQEKQIQISSNYSETSLDAQEIKTILLKAIDQLPEHFRIPIWLVHYENMTVKEVSGSLGKPEKTIRTQLTRGLEKLQNILGKQNATLQGINISVVLSTAKKAEQIPPSLIEKIKNISNLKFSRKIAIQPLYNKGYFSLTFKILSTALLIMSISFFIVFTSITTKEKDSSQKLVKNNNPIENKSEPSNTAPFELFCDFSQDELPSWCTLVSGVKMFEMDDNGQCLKADGHNIYIVRLNVPKDKKYFKVSFMFKVVRLYNHSFTFASIYEKNEGCVGYTFKMNTNLNNDDWNFVELDVQDNICVQTVNKRLSMFYVKTNSVDTYTIQTTGMIAKIDNLRIQETKKNVDEDYSNIINLSKEFKNQKFIKPITIPSPIPKITNSNATVYWADEPER